MHVPAKSVVSVFPRPISSCTRSQWPPKSNALGSPPPDDRPRLGSLTQAQNFSSYYLRSTSVVYIFQFVVCHLAGMGLILITKVTISVLWMYNITGYRIYGCRISFGCFWPFFADGCSAVSHDSDVSMGRAELKSFYPTILHLISSLLQYLIWQTPVRGSQPGHTQNHGWRF